MTTVRALRPRITVHVSGDRNSGKSTLIAALTQALEANDHRVETKSRWTGPLNLADVFDVEIIESDTPAVVDTSKIEQAFAVLREAATVERQRDDLKEEVDKLRRASAMLQSEIDGRKRKAYELVYAAFGVPVPSGAIAKRLQTGRHGAIDRLAAANLDTMEG